MKGCLGWRKGRQWLPWLSWRVLLRGCSFFIGWMAMRRTSGENGCQALMSCCSERTDHARRRFRIGLNGGTVWTVQGRTWRHAASDERWRRPGREPEADAFEKWSTWERKDLFRLEEDADSQEGQVWKVKIDSRWHIMPVPCISGSEFDSQSDHAWMEFSLSVGHRSCFQRVHVRKDAGKTLCL